MQLEPSDKTKNESGLPVGMVVDVDMMEIQKEI